MKIVLAGTTGFIGREVLAQCISDPSIASIVALSRRDLPAATANNPKLKVVILQDHDFLAYPDSVLQDIRDAQACIWCLGKAGIPNNETTRKVSVDYTIAAARAFSSVLPNDNDETNKFRFVYLSGGIAERDQMKPLWFLQEYRRIRGEVENVLVAHEEENHDAFESYIMRPGMVLTKESSVVDWIRGAAPSVRVDVLAKAMINVAVQGGKDRIFENAEIPEIAK